MGRFKHGVQIFDESGASIMEIGSHVIRENSEFSKELGIISASWGQAEINLNCLFAVLLDVSPSEAAKQLRRREYNSAQKVTSAAKRIARERLTGVELDSVVNILDQFDLIRKMRNRLQHDVWAKKGMDKNKLFCIHSDQYLEFTTQFFAASQRIPSDVQVGHLIALANQFAASIQMGYTINDLQEINRSIDEISRSLMQAMFFHMSKRTYISQIGQ